MRAHFDDCVQDFVCIKVLRFCHKMPNPIQYTPNTASCIILWTQVQNNAILGYEFRKQNGFACCASIFCCLCSRFWGHKVQIHNWLDAKGTVSSWNNAPCPNFSIWVEIYSILVNLDLRARMFWVAWEFYLLFAPHVLWPAGNMLYMSKSTPHTQVVHGEKISGASFRTCTFWSITCFCATIFLHGLYLFCEIYVQYFAASLLRCIPAGAHTTSWCLFT